MGRDLIVCSLLSAVCSRQILSDLEKVSQAWSSGFRRPISNRRFDSAEVLDVAAQVPRLGSSAAHPLLIGRHLHRQNLQRDFAIEFRIFR